MNTTDNINDRMKDFAMNIDEFSIGQVIIDSDGSLCIIENKTTNTIEVYIQKKTKNGVNCRQYFDMNQFNKRFKSL